MTLGLEVRGTDHSPDAASWQLPSGFLLSAFLVPLVLLVSAWVWSWIAWRCLPDVSRGTLDEQYVVLFWGSELPVLVCGALAVVAGCASTVYLLAKRHWWLAVFFVAYDAVFLFGTLLAMFGFIPFKPTGW